MSKTKSIIRIILLILFYLGIISYWLVFSSRVSWLLLVFLTLFFLFDTLSMSQSLKNLKIRPINIVSCHVGEKQSIVINLYNQKKRPLFYPHLSIQCSNLELDDSIFIFFNREYQIVHEWTPKKRGEITEIEIELICYDFFYLFQKSKKIRFNEKALVLPSRVREVNYLNHLLKISNTGTALGHESFDLEKIRAYHPGDSPKKIDWKLSSKQQELMVREYEMYEDKKWLLVFFGRESKYFEALLSDFFYLYEQLKASNISFQLVGKGISSSEVLTNKSFALIEASETPGDLPIEENKQMLIFTPRKTKLLDKALEKLPATQSVQVIEYEKSIKEEKL